MITHARNIGWMHGMQCVRMFLLAMLLATGYVCAEETMQQTLSAPAILDAQDAEETIPLSEPTPSSSVDCSPEENSASVAVILDLATAQRRALEANPSLEAVAEQVAQAREYVLQARSAYFPQIAASYRASRTRLEDDATQGFSDSEGDGHRNHRAHRTHESLTDNLVSSEIDSNSVEDILRAVSGIQGAIGNLSGIGGLGSFSSGDDTENYTLGVTAGLLLFDGFSRRMTYAMARFGREETEAAYQEARRLLIDAVALSFFAVQLARENIEVAKADKEFNARLVKEVTIRCNLGKASVSDISNFEVRQLAAEAALITAEKDYMSARIALALVMGEPDVWLPEDVEVAPLPAERDEDMRLPDEAAAIQYALQSRPDLIQKDLSVERAKASVKERYGSLSPRVSLFASWNDQRTERGSYEQKNEATTIGVDVSYDIFTGGRKRSRIAEAKHAKKQAEYKRTEAERKVVSDVRQAVLELKTAQNQLILQRAASEKVRKNRDLVELEYKAGKAPLVRLNQGQRDLVEAQVRFVFARVNLLKAWHELETATGESIEKFTDEE